MYIKLLNFTTIHWQENTDTSLHEKDSLTRILNVNVNGLCGCVGYQPLKFHLTNQWQLESKVDGEL